MDPVPRAAAASPRGRSPRLRRRSADRLSVLSDRPTVVVGCGVSLHAIWLHRVCAQSVMCSLAAPADGPSFELAVDVSDVDAPLWLAFAFQHLFGNFNAFPCACPRNRCSGRLRGRHFDCSRRQPHCTRCRRRWVRPVGTAGPERRQPLAFLFSSRVDLRARCTAGLERRSSSCSGG